jgi:alpha-glucosidase
MTAAPDPWWRHAVCYQIYVRSFADSDGDGLGDLAGIEQRLPYLARLGVDAIWLTPFYTSPQHDHGYDVADYRDVDPRFGTLADFDAMLARAHQLGLRVIVDIVPNHTSSEHPWFRAALADPNGPERRRYLFRAGHGPGGEEPPNNWRSVFGGPAWTRVDDPAARPGSARAAGPEREARPEPPAQWYLHLFDATQPDLDWTNPEVGDEFCSILRFWLDRGVDGFRIDVAHGLRKQEGLPDVADPLRRRPSTMVERSAEDEPMWDRPEVHEVYRRWRKELDGYPGDRMAIAEAWVTSPSSMARYIRPDELHQAFNFLWLTAPWSADAFRRVIEQTLAAVGRVQASPTWVLSNHDVVRHPTRYGGGARGLARARAATLTMLGLPGSAYLYQGEELGLEQVYVPRRFWQDPGALRTGEEGRDGCRVPMPWSGDRPPYGFSPGAGQPWLPQPADWAPLTVSAQEADPGSTLAFYRRLLAARRDFAVAAGDTVELIDTSQPVLAFRRGTLVCAVNCGSRPAAPPDEAGDLLIASGPGAADRLPPDTAAWYRAAAAIQS